MITNDIINNIFDNPNTEPKIVEQIIQKCSNPIIRYFFNASK